MISVNQLSKRFGKLQALDALSLELQAGCSYALIGPNGSGKTTFIKSILGLVLPDSGTIHMDGENISKHWQYRDKIGYMPQIGHYPENIRIGQLLNMVQDIRQYHGAFDDHLYKAFRFDQLLNKRMHTLSGGTRQKVSAVLAFMFKPDVLILDEPTAGLDPLSVELLKDKIQLEKEAGKLILISSHIMSDLDHIASEMVYLYEGKLLYNDSIQKLKAETGEERLGRAIAKLMSDSVNS